MSKKNKKKLRGDPLFVTCAAGTELALREEIGELGLSGAKADRGGVRVRGGREAVLRLCFRSRIAGRVLIEVGRFECPDADALYEGVGAIEWERWLDPQLTLAVHSAARKSGLDHTAFIAQRTKDAIVDRQRERHGARSSVDRDDPDLNVFVHLAHDEAGVFLDASGHSLHRRGWRLDGGAAPLKETLAAAILRLSSWDRERPLLDPMCGSGTLPIEADLYGRNVPTQPRTRRLGMMRWLDWDDAARAQLADFIEDTADRVFATGAACFGSDTSGAQITNAKANAQRAKSDARFEVQELARFEPPSGAHLVMNPPYGERLDYDRELHGELARLLERHDGPVSVLFPEDATLEGLPRPHARDPLRNGALACTLVHW